MRQYFYDREQGQLVAFDSDTMQVEPLERVGSGSALEAPPPRKSEGAAAPVGKRKYKKRKFSDTELFPTRKTKEPNHAGKAWQKTRPPCDECGSKGSRHFKTCSKAGQPHAEKTKPFAPTTSTAMPGQPLTQMTFGRVKISQSHDVPAAEIARNLDVDVAEVEKAFEHETYSEYRAA